VALAVKGLPWARRLQRLRGAWVVGKGEGGCVAVDMLRGLGGERGGGA